MIVRFLRLGIVVLVACGPVAETDRESPENTADGGPPTTAIDGSGPREERVAAAVGLLAGPGGPGRVTSVLRDSTAMLRAVLSAAPDSDRLRLAAVLLDSAEGEAKIDYAAMLVAAGDPAIGPLMELLESSDDWQAQVQALQALGHLKAEAALGVMRTKLQDRNTWVRMASAHAVGEIGGDAAVEALELALADSEDTVVSAALIALGHTGSERALPLCASMRDHGNPRVRGAAVSAIGRLGSGADAHLVTPLLDDPDQGVRYKAQQALGALRSGG